MATTYESSSSALTMQQMTFGDRIEFLINRRGMSKLWLAERLGITKQALNYLIKHSSKPKYIDELAEIMQANPMWIELGEGRPFVDDNQKIGFEGTPLLRIYDSQSIGSYFQGKEESYVGQQFIEYSSAKNDNFFAFRIENDSVFPPFMENTILIFEKNKKPCNGDYVMIVINNNKTVLVRQYALDGNDVYFNSRNKDYKSLVNIDATIFGVLIEARYLL